MDPYEWYFESFQNYTSYFASLHHRNGGDKGDDGIEGDIDNDT